MRYVTETAAADEDSADGVYEIVHGVDVGAEVRPVRHGARRREKSAEHHDAYHEEPHDEDGLLHSVAVIADYKS